MPLASLCYFLIPCRVTIGINPILIRNRKPIKLENFWYKKNLIFPSGAGYPDPKSIILKTTIYKNIIPTKMQSLSKINGGAIINNKVHNMYLTILYFLVS